MNESVLDPLYGLEIAHGEHDTFPVAQMEDQAIKRSTSSMPVV